MNRELHEAVKEVAALLKKVYQEHNNVLSIRESTYRDYIEVHIYTWEAFKEMFNDYEIRYNDSKKYPHEAFFRTEGIEYFCLIKEGEEI